MINQEIVKSRLHYDADTGIFTWISSGKRAGCNHSLGYRKLRINGKSYKEHRLAWLYIYGDFPSGDIDHINRIKNDNRISNLREATESQNAQNIVNAQSHNKTGVLGVTKYGNKYQASIQINGIKKYLGGFTELEDAKNAYLAAKRKLHTFCIIE